MATSCGIKNAVILTKAAAEQKPVPIPPGIMYKDSQNTLGGLIAGAFIRRTGQFKVLLILAGLVASVAYLLLILRWNPATVAEAFDVT
jgi:hypothetical protein